MCCFLSTTRLPHTSSRTLPPATACHAPRNIATAATIVNTTAITWRNTLTAIELAGVQTSLTGTITVICPTAANFTLPTVVRASGTGSCSAVTCPKLTLAAKEGVDCTFTCVSTVSAVNVSVVVTSLGSAPKSFPDGSPTVPVQWRYLNDSATSCVFHTDPLFVGTPGWTNPTVCYWDATPAAPRVINWAILTPQPSASQCAVGDVNYTVTNVANVVTGDGSNDTRNSSTSNATVTCPTTKMTVTIAYVRRTTFYW